MSQESGKTKILVADDDDTVAKFLETALGLKGYAVTVVSSGQEALEWTGRGIFKIILLDLGLKDMSGMRVLEQIKKYSPALPVIMVTGCHDETEARRALELGAFDYITKPVDMNYLIRVLDLQFLNDRGQHE